MASNIPYQAILASQNFFFSSMSIATFEREGILAGSMGIDNPFFNLVLHTELEEEALLIAMPELEEFYAEQKMPWTWLVFPFSKPNGLGNFLENRGMKEIESFAVMGRDMAAALPEPSFSAFSIREVKTYQDFDDWSIPLQEGFESTKEKTLQFQTLTERIPYGDGNHFHHYVLYVNNTPVAAATLSLHEGNIRLDNIAVRSAYQKKGYGTAITYHLLTEAKRLGAKYCFLDASHQGIVTYQKMGFQEYYTGQLYGKQQSE